MDQIEKLFFRIENLKKMGALEEALAILLMMREKVPAVRMEVQREILKVKLLQGSYEEALYEALPYVQEGDANIWQWLLREYYEPFQQEHQKIQQVNKDRLDTYQYFYGNRITSDSKILWYDETGKLVFEQKNRISILTDCQCEYTSGSVVLCNVLSMDKLLAYKDKTEYDGILPHYKEPIYLYYDQDIFDALLQCVDLDQLLIGSRVVFLVGEENVKLFFGDIQTVTPQYILGYGKEKVQQIIDQIYEEKCIQFLFDQKQINDYYSRSWDTIVERIKARKPRVLFMTSYFTTVLKYHTRDCKKALQKIGLDTELLIEKEAIFRNNIYYRASVMNSFRPDIVFGIDHFRFEYEFEFPENLVFINWVQDLLPAVISADTIRKLGNRDFVLNHFTTWKEFKKLGYPSENLIEAPIPASSDVYKRYELTQEEYHRFQCDICFVCHASDADAHIKRFITYNRFEDSKAEMIYKIYKGYQSYIYETDSFFYDRNSFCDFVKGSFFQCFGKRLKPEFLELVTNDMYNRFNQRVYRQVLVDWIIDAGFTNIKLWGNGWMDNDKYRAYAMGPAENGETLSKIYQASKIVVGNNVMTTSAARAWETMLSGGFYMSNYIPEEEDITDIRKIIEVGKDVVMFYNREDLIKKIHYYLEHEEERQRMIKCGRKAALEKMTFDILMKRTLSEVAERLEKNEKDRV